MSPELPQEMASLVEVLVRPLLVFPDDLKIEYADEDETVYVDINVNEADAGKVIGRQGRVIKAIRTIIRAAASREHAMAEVELID